MRQHLICIKKNFFQYYYVFLLIIVPIIALLLFIHSFGVNVLYMDAWSKIPFFEKYYNGTLTINDFFNPHNEHITPFYWVYLILTLSFSHWAIIIDLYFAWIILVCIFISIFLLFFLHRDITRYTLVYFLPVSYLLFNFRQWESILQDGQFNLYLCILGFILSIHFLDLTNKIDYKFFLSLFCAIFCSFSFFNGLIVWPIGFFFIILSKSESKRLLLIWGLTGIATLCLYFINWVHPSGHPSMLYPFIHPDVGILYFIANIGSPLGYNLKTSIVMGFFILIGLVFLSIKLFHYRLVKQNAVWISLILFSLLSSLMMTIGRSGFGIEQATSPRYVTFTIIGIVGLYLLTISINNAILIPDKKMAIFLKGFIVLIIFGLICANVSGLQSGRNYENLKESLQDYLIGYPTGTDEQLKKLYPDIEYVRNTASFLEKHKLDVFYLPNNGKWLNKPIFIETYPGQEFLTNSVRINGIHKYSIFEYPLIDKDSIIEFNNLSFTNSSHLQFSIGLDPDTWSPEFGDGVDFKIYFVSNGSKNLIFSKYINPKTNCNERQWNDYNVSLSKYAGENRTLIFSTSPGPVNNNSYDIAYWGNPKIVNILEN